MNFLLVKWTSFSHKMDLLLLPPPWIKQALDINVEGMVNFFVKELNTEVNSLMLIVATKQFQFHWDKFFVRWKRVREAGVGRRWRLWRSPLARRWRPWRSSSGGPLGRRWRSRDGRSLEQNTTSGSSYDSWDVYGKHCKSFDHYKWLLV